MKRRNLLLGSAGLLVPALSRSATPCAPSPVSVAGGTSVTAACPGSQAIYSTNFPTTENPLNEGGRWANGGTIGLDWTNVQTSSVGAFATQVAHLVPPYDDSIACLVTSFAPDQWAQGTIKNSSANLREVELLLRWNLSAHSSHGYEIDVASTGTLSVVRWNGAVNDFSYLAQNIRAGVSIADGAVWYAQIVGSTITVKCNGTQVWSGTDSVWTGGHPGLGFYAETNNSAAPSANNTFSWGSWSAGIFS